MTDERSDRTTTETSDRQLTVERTFDAPPERVFSAFTDPDEFAEWYGPGSMTVEVTEFNPQPDGTYSITMEGGGHSQTIEGRFVEVVENERLVRTAQMPPGGETVVTVTFEEVDGGTRVVLTHEEFESEEGVQGAAQAWAGSFEQLADLL